jgi:cyclophilin family peptidyl-prolyl cis-trans isomerase
MAVPEMLRVAGRDDILPDVASSFAEAFGQLHAEAARPQLQAWLKNPSASLRAAAVVALDTMGDKNLKVEPIARDITHDVREPTAAAQRPTSLVVSTARGTFEISLDVEQAPKTAAHFIRLAQAKYFDGLTFHRVVPDFVVQGGDPHGDGEGGPGYAIACEINQRRYERGTVGVALSGKDTGGSQFFVTLAPQPHLDGRYTTFGHVVSGMETVDALVEGDAILQVGVKAEPLR